MDATSSKPLGKRAATIVSLGLAIGILVPLVPAWRGSEGDSFPFSWYPMFSRPRPSPERAVYVIGVDPDGARHVVPSRYYARGTMNQARRQLQKQAVRPATAEALCGRIAERLEETKRGPLRKVATVRIVRGWFDMEAYFGRGEKEPIREVVFTECSVDRTSSRKAGEPPRP